MRRQHFDEIEADFQEYYNLDFAQVPSVRAARLLFQLPQRARIFKKLQPANNWGWDEVLANQMVYLLNVIAWQSTKDAQKKFPLKAPKPFVPDFMRDMEKSKEINKDIEAHDIDELNELLSRPRT